MGVPNDEDLPYDILDKEVSKTRNCSGLLTNQHSLLQNAFVSINNFFKMEAIMKYLTYFAFFK